MRETHRYLLIISRLLFGILAGGCLFSQNPGMKYSRDFTINDYGLQQQNWWITQDQTGIIYAANQDKVGLLKAEGDLFRLSPGGERFASIPTIFMIVPLDNQEGKLLIGTREEGFFIYFFFERHYFLL